MTNPSKEREEQFALAFQDYRKCLCFHAYCKVCDRAASEDLVQDTFMKTWNYLARGGKIAAMKAFLYHVLNNLIIDRYRKRRPTSLDRLLENGYPEPGNKDEEMICNIIDGKAACLLLAELPEKYRELMRMRYMEDLSLKEISAKSGQPENTIAVQLHRGLKKLKSIYERAHSLGKRKDKEPALS